MKLKTITTPIGTAVYPWLNEPDTKFESQRAKGGEFHVNVRLVETDATPLIKELEDTLKEWVKVKNQEQKDAKKKPYAAFGTKPWREVLDDEGNPTGEWDVICKLGKQWTDRDGNTRENKIAFRDAAMSPFTPDDIIGSGSRIRVNFKVRGWASPLGACLAFDIVSVQVVELNAMAGGDTTFGFEPTTGFIAITEEGDGPSEDVTAAEAADGDF